MWKIYIEQDLDSCINFRQQHIHWEIGLLCMMWCGLMWCYISDTFHDSRGSKYGLWGPPTQTRLWDEKSKFLYFFYFLLFSGELQDARTVRCTQNSKKKSQNFKMLTQNSWEKKLWVYNLQFWVKPALESHVLAQGSKLSP